MPEIVASVPSVRPVPFVSGDFFSITLAAGANQVRGYEIVHELHDPGEYGTATPPTGLGTASFMRATGYLVDVELMVQTDAGTSVRSFIRGGPPSTGVGPAVVGRLYFLGHLHPGVPLFGTWRMFGPFLSFQVINDSAVSVDVSGSFLFRGW